MKKLLERLPGDEWARLAPYFQRRELKQGDLLAETGEPVKNLYFPDGCVTSTLATTPDGQTLEVGLMGVDGVVGLSVLLGAQLSSTTVTVQVPGPADVISTGDFIEHVMKGNGEARAIMLRYVHAFLGMVSQNAACNATHAIEQRFARWILMVDDRAKREEIPLTHEFLALMLGVRRASVSVAAKRFQDRGIISYMRGMLTIRDRAALEAESCACYNILRELSDDYEARAFKPLTHDFRPPQHD